PGGQTREELGHDERARGGDRPGVDGSGAEVPGDQRPREGAGRGARDGPRARRPLLQNLDPVHRVTIVARGTAALGLTMTRPLEDRYMATEPELEDLLAFAMAGRVAEEVVFGEGSPGGPNDLEKGTEVGSALAAEGGLS